MANGSYEVTHQKILDSGKKLFLKNGYERTNLRELCKAAGVTTGAFYRHFEDKSANLWMKPPGGFYLNLI